MAQKRVTGDDSIQEILPLLDQELSRLPDKYRVPIILCDLEGKTRKKAAQQLGLPEATLSMRLDRARVMLAKRLARHGTILSGSALALAISQNMASAAVPHSIVSATVKAASVLAAGQAVAISAKVVAITEGVLTSMFLTKVKLVTTVLLLAGAVCAGAAVSNHVLTAETNGTQQVGNSAPVAQEIPKKDRRDDLKESSKQLATEDPKIRELRKDRVKALRKRLDFITERYNVAKITVDAVIPAFSQFFHAELDFCESDQERLAICERCLSVAKGFEKDTDLRAKAGDQMAPPDIVQAWVGDAVGGRNCLRASKD